MIGDRVRLVRTDDPYTNLKPGDVGTVFLVDDFGTQHIKWDNGSTLGLVPEVDTWETFDRCPTCSTSLGNPPQSDNCPVPEQHMA